MYHYTVSQIEETKSNNDNVCTQYPEALTILHQTSR